jgi:NAD(P)-dependent dehydrogenase (short-subunit alcohol dehydrogenase family)
MLKRLQGRVALITAAGSGMGQASALRFAAEGAHVIVSDLDEAAAKRVVSQIASEGGSSEAVACDVGEIAQLRQVFDDIERDHGVLHVLFNHAGIPGPAGLDIEPEEWEHAVNVNLRSAFYATRYALPLLRKADGKGSVIFTSSVSGIVGSPFSPLYSMTKGGIILLMKALAVSLAPDAIRSNAICPAMVETPMLSEFFGRDSGANIDDLKSGYMASVPLGRVAAPEEVASAAAFLASDDASWITGVALPVDGGFLA